MSHEYRLDFRAQQMTQLNHAIRMAQQHLGATRSQISCGHADLTVVPRRVEGGVAQQSHLKADMRAVDGARFQDRLEAKDRHGLKSTLAAGGPHLGAGKLGDWRDVPANFEVGDQATAHTKGFRRLTEFECSALEGAQIALLEHTDEHGKKTLHIGIDKELQDEKGEWLSPEAKAVFDRFQASLAVAQDVALEEGHVHSEHQSSVDAALELAGLEPVEHENMADQRTHTVFSNTATAGGKTNKAGG